MNRLTDTLILQAAKLRAVGDALHVAGDKDSARRYLDTANKLTQAATALLALDQFNNGLKE